MLKIGILGATGYAGEELIKILLRHPGVKITSVSAKIDKPQHISKIFPQFSGRLNLVCKQPDIKEIQSKCDFVFLALPHTVSMEIAPQFLNKGIKVIDLSADFRLKDVNLYEKFYGAKHKANKYIFISVYGLPEFYRDKIKKAKLIANPGCYPTAAILAAAPVIIKKLVDVKTNIIIDAKSGITGAGRTPRDDLQFSQANENVVAYKVNVHQHMPEINQEFSYLARKKLDVIFVPHRIPMDRGILTTVYLKLNKGISKVALLYIYKNFYKKEPFMRVLDDGCLPQTRYITNTNYCDIGIVMDEKKNVAIIISAIDNLLKGAAGQAVQNMNIMAGFKETEGLL